MSLEIVQKGFLEVTAKQGRIKERKKFLFDVKRRKRDRDEQYIQSTYGSETKCERRRMGAKATRGRSKTRQILILVL